MSIFDVIRYLFGDPLTIALALIVWVALFTIAGYLKYKFEKAIMLSSDEPEQYEVMGFGDDGEIIYAHEKPKNEEL